MNHMSFNSQYKYIPFLVMFYISLALCFPILVNKPILLPFGVLSAPVLIVPFWFITTTIITEVYGFKINMKLFWSTIVCLYIAAFIVHFLLNLTSSPSWKSQNGYEYVLGNFTNVTILTSIALIVSTRANSYLLARWKVLLQGRYFWLRGLITTLLGEFILTVVLFPTHVLFENQTFSKEAGFLFAWLIVLQIASTIILVPLSTFIIKLLKKIDNIDVYDKEIDFNPLHNFIYEK